MLFIGKKVQNCVNIPQEICRDVPVAQCKIVPTLTPRYKTVRECSRCEKYDDVVVDIEYKKNCQRLEKQNCHTEYKEVNKIRINQILSSLALKRPPPPPGGCSPPWPAASLGSAWWRPPRRGSGCASRPSRPPVPPCSSVCLLVYQL